MKKHNILLLFVILLAAFLRLINVPSNPPSLSWDEVSLGYNAYSIAKTGTDEHGKVFPLSNFEAYGDYKPPAYIYVLVPFVAALGLTEFAVRFPSILSGIISVILTYYIVTELFWKSKHRTWIALLSSLFLALSPWHLILSRAAYEANLAHMFILFGILLFLIAIHRKPPLLIASSVFFVLSLYTFNSARIFVPLLGFSFLLLYWRILWKNKQWVVVSLVVSLVLLAPLIPHLLSREGKLRFQEVNIFTDIRPVETANARIAASGNTWWAVLIHNRRVQFAREIARHYFDNLSMNFLFINGDGNPKFSIRDVGQLYLWDLPFLIIGIYMLVKKREGEWKLLLVWLLLGIAPASIARETPHALRTLNTLPTWQIFVSIGFFTFISSMEARKSLLKQSAVGVVLLLFFGNVLYFLYTYHTSYPKEFASEWQYGYREALAYVGTVKDNYDKIWITDEIGRAYMYTLFYTKYDPLQFQKEAVRTVDPQGFFTVHRFGKYEFSPLKDLSGEKVLFVASPGKAPSSAHILHTVYYPNGKAALEIYD